MVDKGTKYYDSAIHEWHLPRVSKSDCIRARLRKYIYYNIQIIDNNICRPSLIAVPLTRSSKKVIKKRTAKSIVYSPYEIYRNELRRLK